ncbi:quinolinate synthase NadA [Oceanomicrobium pacificus]|uniref:Quinolinate synthase n=1 Tax=Oceanomicrobium pacificus TaxID=2692916 RepID=A0A6B0TR99_9RHOB|nr:quinolinate synthase NadA [Oceanomicrobium pacificus]MXU63884.1 quinolinate synthase NadA [Oceanomicrobium pacificus]
MLNLQDMSAELAASYDLEPSLTLVDEMRDIYERVDRVLPEVEFAGYAPYIRAINRLKAERNAVILAHNYMTPQIYHGVADVVGDSLQLAIAATKVDAEVIVQCGVHFMAETSKILNPQKTVLIPDATAGCSLAASVTSADIARMRAEYPGAPVVSYVNTTAAVKAASDICCTSANAVQIVDAMEGDTVIMTPDGFLAQNVARESRKRVVYWQGSCIVHEQYTAAELREYRAHDPGLKIIAHPECQPEVAEEADYTGSTSGMIDWVRDNRPEKVMLVTECSMASNIADSVPDVEFAKPCNLCPYMKKITLEKILWSLHRMGEEVTVPAEHLEPARAAVERMIDLSQRLNV